MRGKCTNCDDETRLYYVTADGVWLCQGCIDAVLLKSKRPHTRKED